MAASEKATLHSPLTVPAAAATGRVDKAEVSHLMNCVNNSIISAEDSFNLAKRVVLHQMPGHRGQHLWMTSGDGKERKENGKRMRRMSTKAEFRPTGL